MNSNRRFLWVAATGLLLVATIILVGLTVPAYSDGKTAPVPDGYTSILTFRHDGRLLSFGPFVGYYFRPTGSNGNDTVDFICRNERQFYTTDLPVDALLFEGRGVLTTLPNSEQPIPRNHRINPVFFADAPDTWLETRPDPKGLYSHFHSCYNEQGAVRTGYWLRHTAKAAFTYDMGGRVGKDSPLHHEVMPGEDKAFPTIIEFDHGPEFASDS